MDRFTEQSAADLERNSQSQPEDDWLDEDDFGREAPLGPSGEAQGVAPVEAPGEIGCTLF